MSKDKGKPEVREKLMVAAVELSEEVGFTNVRRDDIAVRAGVSSGLVHHYLGTMGQVQRAVIRRACATGNLKVIAQGLADGNRHAQEMPERTKKRALATMMG